jgi:DNA-binding GntR family transcriptional regulator
MKDLADTSSLAAEAYFIVRQRILRGELGLGQVISRRKIAAELGMSFLPVTEALLRLEFEGLLESRPRAGTRVRIPSRDDLRGHYQVREALEVQAALLFMQVATAAERAELRRLAVRVDILSARSERALFVLLHNKLHQRIAECTRCAALTEAIEKTHALASTWYCINRPPSRDNPPRLHQDLLAALVGSDPVRATEAVRQHIAIGMEYALEQLAPYFELRKANGRRFVRRERKPKLRPLVAAPKAAVSARASGRSRNAPHRTAAVPGSGRARRLPPSRGA